MAELNLGNVRPLIPLNVDAPMHTTYRKLLDPLSSAKRIKALEDDIARRVNGFVDTFIERGERHFHRRVRRPVPVVGVVDAVLLDVPRPSRGPTTRRHLKRPGHRRVGGESACTPDSVLSRGSVAAIPLG
jgi:cytochrome P450